MRVFVIGLAALTAAALAGPACAQIYRGGTDYSVTASAIPGSGLSLLITIPADTSFKRQKVEIQNQSTGVIQVVKDDGAGNNATSFFLGAASAVYGQGGAWSSATFNGRVRVYGVAGAQISASTD